MKLSQYLNKSIDIAKQQQIQESIDTKLVNMFRGKPFYCEWENNNSSNNKDTAKNQQNRYHDEKLPETGTYQESVTSHQPTTSTISKPYASNSSRPSALNGLSYTAENCCFNHIIGLPKNKHGTPNELFDYQHKLFTTLQSNKLVWLLKATGLGITEFMIRFIAWLCLKDNQLKNTQIVIVTGPRLEKATEIIQRMKNLFINAEIIKSFDTKQTTLILNGVLIQAYPSDHLDDARGIPNVSFIYVDEAAFFSNKEQQNLRDITERYIIKSNPWIVLTSTPNRPDDIMAQIMAEPNSLYTKLYFDYRVGIGRMWTLQEIEMQKQSPSFQREYNLKFLGGAGDIFNPLDIDQITNESYPLTKDQWFVTWMGLDPGWGSSETGIVIVRLRDTKLETVYAESFARPLYNDIINRVRQLALDWSTCKIFVDGSAAGLIKELKHSYGNSEYLNYHLLDEEVIRQWEQGPCDFNKIVPINFRTRHKDMMGSLVQIISKRLIRIHPTFDKLVIALRTAKARSELDYDKQQSSYSDLLDAMMLSCVAVRFN